MIVYLAVKKGQPLTIILSTADERIRCIFITITPVLDFLTETGNDGKPCHFDPEKETTTRLRPLENDIVPLIKGQPFKQVFQIRYLAYITKHVFWPSFD